MSAAGETWVWEGFRRIPVEGAALYPQLFRYIGETGFAERPGDTLEVGSGDGAMWQGDGRALLELLARRGDVWLTDADEALAKALADSALCRVPRVYARHVDVRGLPFANHTFSRVLAVHVLHWCKQPADVIAAVAELEGVLVPAGRALVVTADENVHMAELYRALAEAKRRLEARGVAVSEPIPAASPRILPFCAGNAEPFLGERFKDIRRVALRYAHVLAGPPSPRFGSAGEFMAAYVRTLPFVAAATRQGTLPPQFADEAGALVQETIDREGAFRMSRCDVLFDCARERGTR